MEPSSELAHDFSPLFRVYKDGRVERLTGTATVPPSLDHANTGGVQSKDVTISPDSSVSARLYLPRNSITSSGGDGAPPPSSKLPLLVYFHGGGFCIESAFSPLYHNYLNSLVAEANVVAVSVEYRLAPEHPLPIAYDDCWSALEWVVVASQSDGGVGEPWLRDHADLRRVFLAGDSAGGNIAHHIALRTSLSPQKIGINLQGIVLLHPYFWGEERIGLEGADPMWKFHTGLWRLVSPPDSSGCDDPLINPAKDEQLRRLGCGRVMVAVAGKDLLRDRGWYYKELLEKSGWGGAAEVVETTGEGHVFFLFNPDTDKAVALLKRVSAFLNEQPK